MNFPRLSVVIPTADRAETLEYTLQTVLDQSYENMQILVCDNYSSDHTRDLIASQQDSRIAYFRTSSRLGMSENWEYALSRVDGDYVFFLGDDDGMIPGACNSVASLLTKFGPAALTWRKPDYLWPSAPIDHNYLTLEVDNALYSLNGRLMLRAVGLGLAGYGILPNIYSSFISVRIIELIKSANGRFFNSVTPDVYSGIVLSAAVGIYLYSCRPFSINGGSGMSNGLSVFKMDNSIDRFFAESCIPMNEKIPVLSGSISSCVAEAFLQAQGLDLTANIKLSEYVYINKIVQELNSTSSALKAKAIDRVLALSSSRQLVKAIRRLLANSSASVCSYLYRDDTYKKYIQEYRRKLRLDTSELGISNVYSCSILLSRLLGPYSEPLSPARNFLLVRLIERLLAKI
jgi:glycosyltransferase involved in cell wall biosynthesis